MLVFAYALLYFIIFLFGACIGSFLNVLVYRLPRKLSPVKGRSRCPHCGHVLSADDLVPVVSYLALKRRCRYCGERISPRYALVECFGGLLCVLCYALYGAPGFLFYFGVACVLLTIALIDADTMEIPDSLVIALAVLAIAAIFIEPGIALWPSRIVGLVAVSVPMLLIALLINGAFGGGDIKLMAAAGFLLGWQNALLAFFIGLLLGGVYAAVLLAKKKAGRKAHIAFGPPLCGGIFIALLFGADIIGWYLSLF